MSAGEALRVVLTAEDVVDLVAGRTVVRVVGARDGDGGQLVVAVLPPADDEGPVPRTSIVCPACGWRSRDANDIAEGYCGNCHWWTSVPDMLAQRMDLLDQARARRLATADQIGRKVGAFASTQPGRVDTMRVEVARSLWQALTDDVALHAVRGWSDIGRRGHVRWSVWHVSVVPGDQAPAEGWMLLQACAAGDCTAAHVVGAVDGIRRHVMARS